MKYAGLVLIGLMLIGGLSYGIYNALNDEPEKKSFVVKNNDSFGDDTSEEVNDYSGYSDSEESASYWYVYYDFSGKDKHTGYTIVEIDSPFFDFLKVRSAIKSYKLTKDDYLGITFFKRVSFESYKAYHHR